MNLPQQRRGSYGWGRVLAGLAAVAVGGMLLTLIVGLALAPLTPENGTPAPLVMVGQLAGVATWVPVVWLVARFIFGMRLGDLCSGLSRVRWGLFAKATAIALVGLGGYAVYTHISSGQPVVPITGAVIIGLVAVLVLIPLQALGEELVFRGFGPQLVLGKTGTSVLATVVVSLIFSALFATFHGASDFTAWLVFFVFGVIFAVLVGLTGGLEAAWALHAVNNVLFVGGGVLRGQNLGVKQSNVTVSVDVFIQLAVMIVVAIVVAFVTRAPATAGRR